MAERMPAIFFGHGNPLNALARNAWTDGWAAIGKDIPRPRAVLCVSAHWYLPATLVTGSPAPMVASPEKVPHHRTRPSTLQIYDKSRYDMF